MKTLIISLLSCGWVLAASAHDGTINIDGQIESNTCIVAQDSTDQSVMLGEISSGQLRQAGESSLPVAFSIHLQHCDAAATGVAITFTGDADSVNPALLAIAADPGTATGLGVAINDDRGTAIPLNSASRIYALDPAKSDNPLTFYAQYTATSSNVSAGTANATATFTLTWQ